MNIKPSVSKGAIRMAVGVAVVAAMAVIAGALLLTGVGGATAFNAGGSSSAAQHIQIPQQYTEQCSNGVVVPNPAGNAGLVADCAALLAAKGTLEGTWGNLNWAADRAISDWDGVTIANDRVSQLRLEGGYRLNGTIPSELGNLTNLTSLKVTGNRLTGAIPSELGNLTNLQRLDLRYNRLTGAIPSELGNLANLQHLSLNDNRLTGAIPSELGNLANLQYLSLHYNGLTGAIPSELGSLANLQYLNISSGQLTGAIPSELGNLSNLQHLTLGGPMTGEIPSELGSLANLQYLRIYSSLLTGAIPSELGNLTNLQHLDLRYNRLTGAIPSELGNLANLRALRLSRNRLTGCIPQSLRVPLGTQEIQLIGLPICGATTSATPTPTATSAPRPPAPATPVATPTPTATSAARASATPTPTATSIPGAPATPTPTATSAASNEVMDRLAALERQVGEIPELRRQIAGMATRIARLEGGAGAGVATATPSPTPTPSATPASVIEASPTPTATPSPTPTSVAGTSDGDACVERLAGSGSVNGRWTSDCLTANSSDNRTYYARFYTFTLYAASEVTVTLSSADATPYLFLLEGEGTGGAVMWENGVANASSVTITAALQPGAYTIEASTYSAETGGDFTLEMEVGH